MNYQYGGAPPHAATPRGDPLQSRDCVRFPYSLDETGRFLVDEIRLVILHNSRLTDGFLFAHIALPLPRALRPGYRLWMAL